MEAVTGWGWAVVAGCAFMIGLTKTGIPGLGMLAVVSLTLVVPAKAASGAMLLMLVVGDFIAVGYYRRHAVWRHLIALSPPAAVGVVAGYFILGHINDAQLAWTVGLIVLTLLALNRLRDRLFGARTDWIGRWYVAWPMGALAGVTTMLSNAAGPIIFIYFLAMRLDKHEFIGTGAWYFMLLNLFKVPFSVGRGMITLPTVRADALMVPVIVLGAVVGIAVFKRIPQKAFAIVIELLALAAAVKLLVA